MAESGTYLTLKTKQDRNEQQKSTDGKIKLLKAVQSSRKNYLLILQSRDQGWIARLQHTSVPKVQTHKIRRSMYKDGQTNLNISIKG